MLNGNRQAIKKLSDREVHTKVGQRYAEISRSIKDRFKYPTGREGAAALGYDPAVTLSIHETAAESFCGVGNPFSLGPVYNGDIILDVGCGGGFDCLVSRHYSGRGGQVYGLDLVPEMVAKAKKNLAVAGCEHCNVVLAGSEVIPFPDNTFDLVISNGAIYLSPLKADTFREICRVLKPEGRIQIADVVMKDGLPEKVMACFDGWSG